MDARLAEVLRRLKEIDVDKVCDVKVSGYYLDGDTGADPAKNRGAITINLMTRVHRCGWPIDQDEGWFNLADLIALARMAED